MSWIGRRTLIIGLCFLVCGALQAGDELLWQRGLVEVVAQHEGGERRGGGFIAALDADSVHVVSSAQLVAGVRDIAIYFASGRRERFAAKVGRMQGGEDFGIAVLVVRDRLPTGVTALALAAGDPSPEFVIFDAEGRRQTLRPIRGSDGFTLTSAPGLLIGAPILSEGKVAGLLQSLSGKTVQATSLSRLRAALDAWGGVQNLLPENLTAELRTAIERHDDVRIADLLAEESGLWQRVDAAGRSALHWAVKAGDPRIVKLMLENGATPGPRDTQNVTPLVLAVERNQPELVEILLHAKADPNVLTASGDAAIHVAIWQGRDALVELLLHNGADPNLKSRAERTGRLGMTPLYLAVETGQPNLVEPLLATGASVREQNVYGGTVLNRVIQSWDADLASRLIQVGGKDLEFLGSALNTAIFWMNVDAVRFLLERGADPNYPFRDLLQIVTPLQAVLKLRRAPAVQEKLLRLLLEDGADPSRRNPDGKTSFELARAEGKAWAEELFLRATNSGSRLSDPARAILAASRSGDLARLRAAAGSRGWQDVRDTAGRTPLHLAVEAGHPSIVRWLLEQGADPDRQDEDGNTPLHTTVAARETSSADLLLDRRADPNLLNKAGKTPLHLAIENEDRATITRLLDRGADLEQRTSEDHTPLFLASDTGRFDIALQLLENGANPRSLNDRRRVTPLFAMVRTWSFNPRSEELARTLLARGADIDAGARLGGTTALEAAAFLGQWEAARFLIKAGANVDRRDAAGEPLIHQLVEKGRADLVQLLLDRGIDPLAKDPKGQTALDIARLAGQEEVLTLLEAAHAQRRPAPTPAPVNERIRQATQDLQRGVVKITAYGAGPRRIGAGLVLAVGGDSADILTASHVISGQESLTIAFYARRFEPMPGRVMATEDDPEHGLAWVRVEGKIPLDVRPLTLTKTWPPRNRQGLAIGFPATESEDWHALSTTVLSADNDELRLRRDGIAPGNSGGPLLVNGVVLGVLQSLDADTASATSVPRVREIIAKWRLEVEPSDPGSDLLAAAAAGETRTVEFLLRRFTGLTEARDELGRGALQRAVAAGHLPVVEILLRDGFDPDLLDAQGRTALHLALASAAEPLTRRLLQAEADPGLQTSDGEFPLHLAVRQDNTRLITLLLDHGAKLEVRDAVDRTPLYMAVDEAHLEAALVLLDRDARVNTTHGPRRSTPLARGILNTDLRVARRLIERGADVNGEGPSTATPILLAMFWSRWPAIELLLEYGADPGTANAEDNTLLHHTAERGPASLVRLLLERGANRRARNKEGETPLDLARKAERPEIMELLSPDMR